MTPGKTLFNQLHDPDPAVREAAQRRIAVEVAARGGDAKAAAEALGISVRTARRWMDAFGDLAPPVGADAPEALRDPRAGAGAAAAGAGTVPARRQAARSRRAKAPGKVPSPAGGGSVPEPATHVATPAGPPRIGEPPATADEEVRPAEEPRERPSTPAPTSASAPPGGSEARAPRPAGAAAAPAAEAMRAAPPRPPAGEVAPPGRPQRLQLAPPFRDFRPGHARPLDVQARDGADPAAVPQRPPHAVAAPGAEPVAAAEPGSPRESRAAARSPQQASVTPAAAGAAAVAGPAGAIPSPAGEVARARGVAGRRAGEWPHHQPDAPPAAAAGDADGGPRRLAFVLHAHLPWVLGHGTWPHGEDWLAEAVVHCYLPLVGALERLAARGGRDLLTLSLSPVLAAQLADPRTPPLVAGYLGHRLAAARDLAQQHPLAPWWEATYERLAADWERRAGDLVGAAARLADAGAIELATCAATHGYLPLLHRAEHVALQVGAAMANHERWFGRRPAGLWMPECAYRPGGAWLHPATGATEHQRAGNEAFLAREGVRWTVVDAHLVLGGEPVVPYDLVWAAGGEGPSAAVAAPVAARLQPQRIGGSAVVALPREPHTAHQVWSRHGGYPGDPRYLDFHKRHADSGLRLWSVTDVGGDLAGKLPYHPDAAAVAVRDQAAHFVDLVARVPGLAGGVAVCPYDAELFGHWWFEGVDWLEAVLGRCLDDGRVTATTPSRDLRDHPPADAVRLREGSWGEGGDHRVWLNDGTRWMWEALREAEEAVAAALVAAPPRRARALLAQLLLLAASDWPFLVTTGTAADYAAERFREHRNRLQRLLDAGDDAALPAWVDEDLAGLQLDPAWWRRGEG